VGEALLGRAVDGLGRPIDGGPPIPRLTLAALDAAAAPALDRLSPTERLDTGVRAIDTLLTLAKGQRIGVFAASGVGKTTLLTQLVNQIDADVCVICLVGERGREVEELWAHDLPAAARRRSVLVAATSDQSAALRARACSYALAAADHWRARGAHVLLVVDSVTRYAMALREIGLAAGEPPTVRAYTPGVFAALPRLVEGCGAVRGQGAITAIFTVLSETDDVDDPISETMRSILDGHIVLSRELAEQAHFPAIDVPRSISRLARSVQSAADRACAEDAIARLSTYEAARTLIETGVYRSGANPGIDAALAARPRLLAFLQQGAHESTPAEAARRALAEALASVSGAAA
jgi:flagellum-specific ATP synthase